MDFSTIKDNLPLLVAVLILVLWQFFRRRRQPQTTHREIALGLVSEVRLNLALAETFSRRQKPRKFELTSWQRSKTKLDFLEPSLRGSITNAFALMEDFNQQIDAAKKYKSTSYLANVDVDRLREPLTKSKEGLEQWLLSTAGIKGSPSKHGGIFDDLFGRRD